MNEMGIKRGKSKIIKTPHGSIRTPFFMPDATRGFVKLTDNEELKNMGVKALVVNTLHLYLQPGMKIIKKTTRLRGTSARQGGIHKFMNWSGPILSDSGGFQVFSLVHKKPAMGKISDKGVIFKSPLDGSSHELTPEKSIQIQFDLGVDMMVCLDDCPPNEFSRKDLEKSVERTISWAARCRAEYDRQVKGRKMKVGERPLLFSVIQGGAELDLRKKCAEGLIKIGFDGYGFGARPIDKDGRFLGKVLQFTADLIPKDSIRFGLGIGLPEDIVRAAEMGWDIFDCVIPTREGRHGKLFLWKRNSKFPAFAKATAGRQMSKDFYRTVNINNAKFARDFSPINSESKLPELRNYSKAYLHHLFKLREPLGAKLASLNNLEFYMELMDEIRK
ncbi:MAG: tRNA guanosine(34) transglycosylase Tgt [Patescibacteria group bacterium]|nr:tRNA guanosine(34) transglycosylase Tgt [Patescibacteria group bacterium]MDD5554178.1 tRNA guanosine(34) transglycosylase Tgt [Patescibacteria group bacterium]